MNNIDFTLKNHQGTGNKVLVNEPNEQMVAFVKRIFICEGFEIDFFTNLANLKDKCQISLPDLLYVGLDNENELELVKQIKSDKRLSKVTLIVAGMSKGSENKSLESGADIYIPKPLLFKKLPVLIKASQYDITFS